MVAPDEGCRDSVDAFDPLLRSAVGFVRRGPAWSIAIALAVGAFATARATAPLVTDAAADRSFAAEAAVAASSARLGQGLDARAFTSNLTDVAALETVSGELDDLPVYGPSVAAVSPLLPYTDERDPVPVIRSVDGARQATAIVFALGDTSDSLQPAATATDDGGAPDGAIWIPDTVAAELGVGPGDEVELALEYAVPSDTESDLSTTTTVAGVYVTSDGLPVSDEVDWASLRASLPREPLAPGRTAQLLLTDAGTAMSLLADIGDTTFVRWDLAWQGPVSLEHGRTVAEATTQLNLQMTNSRSLVGQRIANAGADKVVLSSGVGAFVVRAEEAADALEPVVSSIALTGQVMSVMVLVFCVWALSRSRRREHGLSLSMGMHPVRLGLVAVVEQVVPVVVGVASAYVIVRWIPGLVAGEGAIDRRTTDTAATTVLWTLPLTAAAIALVGSAATWPLEPSSASRAKRVAGAFNAETVVVVGALATWAQLMTQKGSALNSGTSLLFPLLAVLAGSVVVVRALALLMRGTAGRRRKGAGRFRVRRPRSLATWSARRRVSYSVTELSALVIVVAAGVGLFVYCSSISSNGERGLSDKAAALGGASATVGILSAGQVTIGADGFPDPPSDWSVVWEISTARMAPNTVADLLVIDPDTFAAAADWRDSFADASLESLLRDVADSEPFDLSIIVAGNYTDQFPDTGEMEVGNGLFVRYRVVARIAAAPWLRERSSIAIVSQHAMAPLIPTHEGVVPGPSNTVGLDRMFRTYVWSNSSQAELSAAIGAATLDTESPNVSTEARRPAFVAFRLSLPYLRLVGAALLAVSLASIVVLGARRRTDLALELAMTDKMGMPRRTTTMAVAGGAVLLGASACLIGVLLALPLVAFMTNRLDPGPAFAPTFNGSLSWTAVAVAVVVVGGVSLVSALFEIRGARRARVTEVLRDAE